MRAQQVLRAAIVAALLAAPRPALAQQNPAHLSINECRKIAKQMIRYGQDIDYAEKWDQELRVEVLDRKLTMLEQRWDVGCDHSDDVMLAKFYDVMKKAGRIALRYFTWGMF
ncbi:MAG TPA: hypothetical protein VMW35_00120 [Myxococcota bacterium]|jgi:hypothetical protein|nr:hypothetical protein [Myxococcota bacterium]